MNFQYLSSFFMQGDIPGALAYMRQFDELKDMVAAYEDLFENEHYIEYDIPTVLNSILLEYQRYFRDVFYLKTDDTTACEALMSRLEALPEVAAEMTEEVSAESTEITPSGESAGQREEAPVDEIAGRRKEMLTAALVSIFEANGYNLLTGRTNGHYGPYVWKETEPTVYEVELPGGTRPYTVNILRGFIMRSWMDYLTFGQFGTGGWASPDGTINCIETEYDFESERFRISLLKHEAQHAEDFRSWPSITPTELEYRAKLVELIYSTTPDPLHKFLNEASKDRPDDSHASASARLSDEMSDLANRPVDEIQARAKVLFEASNAEMGEKYK